MLRSRLLLGVGAKALALTAMSAGASATCMSSASSVSGSIPSISATEVSTAQAVEMVRRRQQEQQGVALASFTPAQPAAQSTTQVSQGTAPQSKGAPKPQAKQAAKPVPAPEPVYPTSAPSRGVWAQGYVDHEKRNDITIDAARPGEIDRKETSAGFLAGGDVTLRFNSSGTTGLMLGLFGGYHNAQGKESAGQFRQTQADPLAPEFFLRTNAEQDTSGGMLGAYAAYFRDRFSWQTVVKFDLFDAKQTDTLDPFQGFDDPSCILAPVNRAASADLTNTILESNVSYRLDAGRDSWIEPIAGLRYTHTDYSDQRGDFIVGADGDVLRVQGGLRYGTFWRMPQGFLTTTLTGMLYSDVWVDGFKAQPGSFGPATLVTDEGELRVLGQVAAKWDRGDGSSYLVQVETRGGEDLFGIGGRIGARYEW
jgi:hypothetical protein